MANHLCISEPGGTNHLCISEPGEGGCGKREDALREMFEVVCRRPAEEGIVKTKYVGKDDQTCGSRG